MINKHKGGSIISDIKNIQNELAYTTDDTYLFNYKNKKQELDKLLYKLSKYEKACKTRKQKKKNQKIEEKKNSIKKKINLVEKKKLSLKKKQDSIKKKEDLIKNEIDIIKNKKKSIKKTEQKKHKEHKKAHKKEHKKAHKNEHKKEHNKEHKKEHNKEHKEEKKMKGGDLISEIPNLLFVPILGPILYEKNKIELENNPHLIEDLLLFIINNLINIIELASIIYIYLNRDNLTTEDIFVVCVILGIRILSSVFIYKKKEQQNESYNKNLHKFLILLVTGLPLLILLFNIECFELLDNMILTFIITILCLPYFRLLYNHLNKNNYISSNGFWINIIEKIICGLIIYIIIKNEYDLNSIFDFIKNIHTVEDINKPNIVDTNIVDTNIVDTNIVDTNNTDNKISVAYKEQFENIEEMEKSSENVLLNNFNNLFKKKYI